MQQQGNHVLLQALASQLEAVKREAAEEARSELEDKLRGETEKWALEHARNDFERERESLYAEIEREKALAWDEAELRLESEHKRLRQEIEDKLGIDREEQQQALAERDAVIAQTADVLLGLIRGLFPAAAKPVYLRRHVAAFDLIGINAVLQTRGYRIEARLVPEERDVDPGDHRGG